MMRRFAALLSLAVAAGSIPAIAAQAVEPPPIVDPVGRVEGTITDAQSGAPIAGACVQAYLFERPWNKVCAGADGTYALAGIWARENVQLVATASGHPARWWPARLDSEVAETFILVAGEVKRADFALSTAVGTIEGLITGNDGIARPYARALLYRTTEADPMGAITAGGDGRFRRADIPPGAYHLSVWDVSATRQWHPRQADRASAATIAITAGGTTRVDERLLGADGATRATMSGQVKDSAGAAVSGATVTVASGRRTLAEVVTDAQGRYAVPNLPVWQLYSVSARHGTRVIWAPQNPTPRASSFDPAQAVDIVMPANPSTIRGKISDFDGTALPRTHFQLYRPNVLVTSASVPINPDGSYEITNVLPGTYQARINLVGRGSFWYPFVDRPDSPPITFEGGDTEVINATVMRPSYVEVTARDQDTREPISGLCLLAPSSPPPPCTGADGVALVGPYWVVPTTTTVTVNMWSNPYYFSALKQAPIRQGETTPAEATYRRGATLEIPIASSLPPGSAQVCVHLFPQVFAIGGDAACGAPEQGVLRMGPYEDQSVKLFVDPLDSGFGSQWLGSNGGTGRQKDAVTLALQRRRVTVTPPVRLDAPGSITGTITPQEAGTPPGDVCARVGTAAYCGQNGKYTIDGLGPYDWEVRYTMPGMATTWTGGASSRVYAGTVKVTPGQSTTANLSVPVEATIYFPASQGQAIEAYDIRSGDRLADGPSTQILGLNSGQVVLRYTGPDGQSCWLTRPFLGRSTYLFVVRTGQQTVIPAVPGPGIGCVTTAPRLGGTPFGFTRHAVGHVPLGAMVQQELQRLFP